MTDTVRLDRETRITQGSQPWYDMRVGLTIGSSECAKAFSGIVTGSARKELCDKFAGRPRPVIPAYAQAIMDEGKKMEPYLLREVGALLGGTILSANLFKMEKKTGTVLEFSSPDSIVLTTGYPKRLALIEIKYRPTSTDDSGWGPMRDRMDIKIWCQAQHQMHITGIHRCFVYSGSPTGARRLWTIAYCPEFRPVFVAELAACVAQKRGLSAGDSQIKLGRMMALTTKLEYVKRGSGSGPEDEEVEEIKGGRESSDTEEGGCTESTETLSGNSEECALD